jgi:hypothetical protein
MTLTIWIIVLVLLAAFALYAVRMAKTSADDNRHDTGQAIIDFSRAFPTEAIRTLHMTSDGNAVFVRLHDNKAGFMRNMGSHYACLLIDPARIRVEPLETGDGFVVDFLDLKKHSGAYRFSSAGEASDVSLWLLGSYAEAADRLPVEEPENDQASTPSSPSTVS